MRFNEQTEALRAQERSTLYETFHIPKKSGGLRRIDAPKPELMNALRNLKTIFEEDFHALYHTSAFAYVKNRCTVDAVKRHQKNNSKWFGKLDLHDFFGSTTLDYVIKMFSMVFPFSEIVKLPNGEAELRKALDLAFLNGGLPQGTPLSPLITNVMMIPVDYKLANAFRDFDKQRFIYTRYADDFIISSKVDFDVHRVEKLVVDTLHEFGAPFTINECICIVVHSGSRRLGLEIANFYQEAAFKALTSYSKEEIEEVVNELKAAGRQKEIQAVLKGMKAKKPGVPKQLAYVEGELFEQYIHDMKIAQRFAELNRQAMMDTIVKGMGFHVEEQFTTIHNYIDVENMILRKGSVSAQAGERLLIPINMRDGSLLCTGKGNEDWNFSAPHGAGRLMSRSAAKETFTVSEFKKQMEGIYTTSVGRSTLDECPMAYKGMDDIVNNVEPTVTIDAIIKPIYNFKAGEEE